MIALRSKPFLSTAFVGAIVLTLAACDNAEEAAAGPIERSEAVAEVDPPAGTQWSDQVQMTERGGYLVGNPDAPIKLVEYGSLTCPACAAFSAQAKEPLMQDYVNSGRVSFELRSLLLGGPLDLALTRLIECGQPQAIHPLSHQVWSNLDTIFDRVQAAGPQLEAAMSLPEDQRFPAFAQAAGLYDFFAARGLSEEQARQCLADTQRLEQLAEYSQSYSDDDVQGTPTFFLNGNKVDGNQWPAVEAALQRAGAR